MNLKELKTYFTSSLSSLYPLEELQSFFHLLAENILGLSRIEIALEIDKKVSETEKKAFEKAIVRLEKFEPIQYLLGKTEFYGLTFHVNKNVLIPRPETEELVDWILSDCHKNEPSIIDIGTGSGCIAISLANKTPGARVIALDVSLEALKIAEYNASNNKVEIDFIKGDVLQIESNNELRNLAISKFDVIVSNPPYVRNMEKEDMKENVLNFEPDIALFVSDKDPLIFYRKIAQLSLKYLKNNGHLYFEINEYLSEEMKKMLNEVGFKHIELKKDMFGKDRMIKCWQNEKTR